MKTYHDRIMNLQIPKPDDDTRGLPAVVETMEYKEGYRDARHAAAEIANEADGRIEELEQAKQPRRSPWKAAAKRYRRLFRLPTHMVTHCSNCIATEQRSVELEALVASYARQRIRDIQERQRLRADRAELQHSADLQTTASARAITLWQAAHPDRSDIWPDQAALLVWLLEQLDATRAERDGLAVRLRIVERVMGRTDEQMDGMAEW